MARQDKKLINRAYSLFDEFYSAHAPLRQKCAANEEFFKTNHWAGLPESEPGEPRPVTPVLFSTLENLLSDIMDNYPQAVIIGEEPGDDGVAASLDGIVRYILKRRNYRSIYREKCRSALKCGTSVQEVFWDRELYSGLGDVNIREWDIKNFLCDPLCEDIQDGRACFKFGFYTKEYFEARYPGAWAEMKRDTYARGKSKGEEALIMEYWFKTHDKGRDRVHMAKLAGGVILENSVETAPEGMFAHAQYPFIVEPLYALNGESVGLGLIDILKNLQQYADKLDQIILKNALMSGRVRLLVNKNAGLDEYSLTDWSKEVVAGSRIDDDAVRWFQPAPLSPLVLSHFNGKLASIKEESGQNQFVRGETLKGVTAASAIMALQEAGSKRSRLIIEQLYDGFERLVRMIVEVIRENYTEKRRVMINGKTVAMSAKELNKPSGEGTRPIEFDVSVMVEKQTPYRTAYQNEFALSLANAGIIDKSDALDMMTFEGKDKLMEKRKAALSKVDEARDEIVEI